MPIDHVGLIGFEGFKAMTDAVGGVKVYAEESSTGITKGYNTLNGEQALAFVRERHALSEGDISRGRRQQAFIKALMLKGLSRDTLTNPVTLASFIDAGTRNLTLDKDFSVADLRSEAFGMRGIRGQRHRLHHRAVQRVRDEPGRRLDRHRRPAADAGPLGGAAQRRPGRLPRRQADPLT